MLTNDAKLLVQMAKGQCRIRQAPSVEELGEDSSYTGNFISGQPLVAAMQQVYREYLEPLNQSRREGLRQLAKRQRDHVMIDDIVYVITQPLIEAYAGKNGDVVRFCYVGVSEYLATIPKELWWTPELTDCLRALRPETKDDHVWVVSLINKSIHRYIAEESRDMQFPLAVADAQRFKSDIERLVASLLHVVW